MCENSKPLNSLKLCRILKGSPTSLKLSKATCGLYRALLDSLMLSEDL